MNEYEGGKSMKGNPPIKHKCLECGEESYIVLCECCCYDICTCSSPKCKKCNGLLVPKARYKNEVIDFIKGELAQIIEWDEGLDKTDCNVNHAVDFAFKWLDKLK